MNPMHRDAREARDRVDFDLEDSNVKRKSGPQLYAVYLTWPRDITSLDQIRMSTDCTVFPLEKGVVNLVKALNFIGVSTRCSADGETNYGGYGKAAHGKRVFVEVDDTEDILALRLIIGLFNKSSYIKWELTEGPFVHGDLTLTTKHEAGGTFFITDAQESGERLAQWIFNAALRKSSAQERCGLPNAMKERIALCKNTRRSNCIGTALYIAGEIDEDIATPSNTISVYDEHLRILKELERPALGSIIAWLIEYETGSGKRGFVNHMGIVTCLEPLSVTHRNGMYTHQYPNSGIFHVNQNLTEILKTYRVDGVVDYRSKYGLRFFLPKEFEKYNVHTDY